MQQEKVMYSDRERLQRKVFATTTKQETSFLDRIDQDQLNLKISLAKKYKMAQKIEKERNQCVPILDLTQNDLVNKRKLQKLFSYSNFSQCDSPIGYPQSMETNSPASGQIQFAQSAKLNNKTPIFSQRSKYIKELSLEQTQKKKTGKKVRNNLKQRKSQIFNNYNLLKKITSEAFIGTIVIIGILIYKLYQIFYEAKQ